MMRDATSMYEDVVERFKVDRERLFVAEFSMVAMTGPRQKIWTFCKPDIRNSWYNPSRAAAFCGKHDEVIYALDRAVRNGYISYVYVLHDPAFKSILNDKRFIKIIDKLKKE